MRLLILGCGLLGSSVALAAREAGVATSITGFDPNPDSVAAASQLGVFDSVGLMGQAGHEIGADLAADVGIAAGPPSTLVGGVASLASVCELVMDVGSIKGPILAELASAQGAPANFVPCHPMAGSEQAGAGAAQANLFQGRWVFVVSTATAAPAACSAAHKFWQSLGAQTTELAPAAHDAAVAYSSHLPHLLAALYAGLDDVVPAAAGPGYRDFSRLAKSNPALWADILTSNKSQILPLIEQLRTALDEAQALLEQAQPDDATSRGDLVDYLAVRKSARDALDLR